MWKTVKLGEACLVRRGTTITKKQTVEGEVPVIGGGTKPTYFHNESNRAANCITVSGSGASAGFVNKWEAPIFASDCSTIEPKDETQLHQFVYYYLMSQQQLIYDNFRSGAAQPHVYSKDIETLDYPIVSLAEQRRIVAKLDAAFAEIDRAIDIESEKAREVTALYNSRVTQLLANLMHEREHMKLKELCEKITVGYVGKMSNQYIEDGIPFFRSQSIRPYRISSKGLLYISAEFDESIAKSRLKTNDVCVVRTGYPGTAAVVTEEWDGANCSDLVIFTPSLELNPYFLELFFNSDYGKTLVMGKVVGAAQKHFNVTSAKEVDFPVADLDEQQKIVSTAEGLRNSWEYAISAISRKGEKLTSLKSAILVQELQPSQSEAA